MSKRLKENDKAVYEKLAELNATNGSSISTAVTSRENIDQRKKEKIEVRIKNNLKKVKDLKLVVSSITKEPDDMSEDEIRDYLCESVKWEKKLESLTTIRDSIDEEAVCLDIDEDSKAEFDEEFDSLEKAVRDLVKDLTLKDKSLKLYSLSTKSKETVSYPSKFNGKETEDVYKFIKDFQKAITSDRVKKSEELGTLRNYLGDEVKKVVGDHFDDLDTAIEYLKSSYGNPQLIWNKKKEKCERELNFRSWGKVDSMERLKAVNQMQSFIREAQALAKEYDDLKGEIHSNDTLSMIKRCVPSKLREKMNDDIPMSCSKEDKLDRILCILESV